MGLQKINNGDTGALAADKIFANDKFLETKLGVVFSAVYDLTGYPPIFVDLSATRIKFVNLRAAFLDGTFAETSETIEFTDLAQVCYIKATKVGTGARGLELSIVNEHFFYDEGNLEANEYIVAYRDGDAWRSRYSVIASYLARAYSKYEAKFYHDTLGSSYELARDKVTIPIGLRLLRGGRFFESSVANTFETPDENCYIVAVVSGAPETTNSIVLEYRVGHVPPLLTKDNFNDIIVMSRMDFNQWTSPDPIVQDRIRESITLHGDDVYRAGGIKPWETAVYAFNGSDGICYNSGATFRRDGTLKKVRLYARVAGVARFAVGSVDQWQKAIFDSTFTVIVDAPRAGLFDVPEGVRVKKGDELFFIMDSKIVGYNSNAGGVANNKLIYNDRDRNGAMSAFNGVNGGFCGLGYEVIYDPLSLSSLETSLVEVESENERLKAELASVKVNPRVIDSQTGEELKIISKNGVISTESVVFTNVLALGNSITRHPITSFWWGDFGMAAPSRGEDWVHLLEKDLRIKAPQAVVDSFNIAPWETSPHTFNYSSLDSLISGRDAILLRVGENVSNVTDLEDNFRTLVDHITSKNPTAKIFIGGNYWSSVVKDTAMRNVANEKNIPFADFSYMWGAGAIYNSSLDAVIRGDDGQDHVVRDGIPTATTQGVANHPGKLGMIEIKKGFREIMGF